MFIVAAHILGSIVALFAFGFAVLALSAWEQDRNRKAAIREASFALGIPAEELDDPRHTAKVIRFSAERFSSELFRNRLSDLCGVVNSVWGWLGITLQVAVLGAVIWYSFSDSKVAVHAWWMVAIAVLFWVISVVFALICKLLTGRYPGQAKQARKMLAQLVATQRSKAADVDDDWNAA